MTFVFDGKDFARSKEAEIAKKVGELKSQGINPYFVSILASSNPASQLYVRLKKEAAERVGIKSEVTQLEGLHVVEKLKRLIGALNLDNEVNGIMVQLPLGEALTANNTQRITSLIDPKKDVDGLVEGSDFTPATALAVLSITDFAIEKIRLKVSSETKFVVVGSEGMVGKAVVKEYQKRGFNTIGIDIKNNQRLDTYQADILVTATGTPALINKYIVKPGAIVIDCGSPDGDVDIKSFDLNSEDGPAFITPVPGGVGPVTIISLLENVIKAAYNQAQTHT